MQNLFQKVSLPWVRYIGYKCKEANDGNLCITPAAGAKPEIYDSLKSAEQMVLDAFNVAALPTTPSFMAYEAVCLPKNHRLYGISISCCCARK